MARFFKVIMSILLIAFIAVLAALFIPPLFDITTAIAEPGVETNMQVGSVAYGVKTPVSELTVGDTVINNTEDSTYLYEVTAIDTENNELTVVSSENAEPQLVQARENVAKEILVVPYIGYIIIALHSTEGIVILSLAVALLIILFIISDILNRKAHEKKEEPEEDDAEYFRNLALGKTGSADPQAAETIAIPPVADLLDENSSAQPQEEILPLDEEEELPELILEPVEEPSADEIPAVTLPEKEEEAPSPLKDAPEEAARDFSDASEKKRREKLETKKSGGFENEKAEKTETGSDAAAKENAPAGPAEEQGAVMTETAPETETQTETETESATETQDANAGKALTETAEFSRIGDALESALEAEQMDKTTHGNMQPAPAAAVEEAPAKEEPEEIEIAIPAYTLDELLQEAWSRGEDPTVTKDPVTGVTLVDYSNSL